ncbi:MAG TPA: hypothetical protein VFO16_13345 [Pseudonocardiaceae bacterium]|nr:hypothetical protein [Pseudonocardiaceae bacterium]
MSPVPAVGANSLPVPASVPPCPDWCVSAGHRDERPATHLSATRVFEANGWRVEARLYRADDDIPRPASGWTAVEIEISGEQLTGHVDDAGQPSLEGCLMPDEARSLARWLLAQAQEADPHHRNGEPLAE